MKKAVLVSMLSSFLALNSNVYSKNKGNKNQGYEVKNSFYELNEAIRNRNLKEVFEKLYFKAEWDNLSVKFNSVEELYLATKNYFEKNESAKEEYFRKDLSCFLLSYSDKKDFFKSLKIRNFGEDFVEIKEKEKKWWAIKTKNGWKISDKIGAEMDFKLMNWSLDRIVEELNDFKKKNNRYPPCLSYIEKGKLNPPFEDFNVSSVTVDYFNGNRRMYKQYIRGDKCEGSKDDFVIWSVGPDGKNEYGKNEYDAKNGKGDLVRYSSEKFYKKYMNSKCLKN